MSQVQACKTCRFYAPGQETWLPTGLRSSGECRVSSPAPTGQRWPGVMEEDWCGRWRPSDEENQRVRLAIEAAQEQLGE